MGQHKPVSTVKGNMGGKVGRRQHFWEPIADVTAYSSQWLHALVTGLQDYS